MSAELSIDVQNASTVDSVPPEGEIRSWIRDVIEQLGVRLPVEVSVRIVDAEEGRALNSAYRGKDKATNVLSFPAGDGAGAVLPPDVARSLGDIVICAPVVDREAEEQGKNVADHWAHLLVHGALHLLGYDHEKDEDAREMETLETRILAARGLGDPYAA